VSFDPVVLSSLFSSLGSIANTGIQKLIDSKIIVHKGLTFYHRTSELEFAFLISLGDEASRSNDILKKIQSITQKPVEFENIIEIYGHGLPHNENLLSMGIISVSGTSGKIDFGKLLREVKSNTVFIKFRIKIPEELKSHLVPSRIDNTSKHFGKDKIETNIEIALDYANLWKKVFDQYTVRDIEFTFNLEISTETIVEQIPKRYREKIINAARQIAKGNQNAVKFLKIMSDCFLSFEKDVRIQQLLDCVSVEPHDKFIIKSVTPTMESMEIAGIGHPVVLPGKMRITLACVVEGSDVTSLGKLSIDLRKFFKILSEIVLDLQNKTQNLKF